MAVFFTEAYKLSTLEARDLNDLTTNAQDLEITTRLFWLWSKLMISVSEFYLRLTNTYSFNQIFFPNRVAKVIHSQGKIYSPDLSLLYGQFIKAMLDRSLRRNNHTIS